MTNFTPLAAQNLPRTKTQTIVIIALAGIFVLILGLGFYAYSQQKKSQMLQNKLDQNLQSETANLVETVGKLIRLPQGETPSLATVLDKTQLQSQEFFRNAENGDKILVYKNAKKAILYRPSENKIIEVGPVKMEITPAPTIPTASPSGKIIFRPVSIKPTSYQASPSATPKL